MNRPPWRNRAALAVLAAALALVGAGCGSGGGTRDVLADAKAGHLVIGVKFDQPGVGERRPDGSMHGLDIDVATYVAGELGVPKDRISWREAPSPNRENLLRNGEVDFIVASYSISGARLNVVDFAGPYFHAGQSLLVRADEDSIADVASLNSGKRLCSVTGSTPAQNIQKNYPGVQLQQYDSYSACVEALHRHKIDALTTDDVILAGYAAQSPGEFKLVGQPFTDELYGIGLARGQTPAKARINAALQKMFDSAAWDAAVLKALGPSGMQAPARPAIGGLSSVKPVKPAAPEGLWHKYGKRLEQAFATTAELTAAAAAIALGWGVLLVAAQLCPVPILRRASSAFVDVLRNSPLTLVIVFCSTGLYQNLGLTLAAESSRTFIADNNFWLAVLGLAAYTSAFVADSLRSGVNTVPIGQVEAARSLGFGFLKVLRLVVLPQAFRAVIRPLGSQFIALARNTTVASAIGVAEAALLMKAMIENESDRLFEVFGIFALVFGAFSVAFGFLFNVLGRKLEVRR
ncbi:MAG: transporter substrate-binding domain-containing protein [Segniliparus sp.]|uniref:transporter substrate-binding domain-containing protein n=1 Tax=Segniliparus sp. TaxID=2804064 RepID=UPI003F2B6C9C